jgi:hypothetical protein
MSTGPEHFRQAERLLDGTPSDQKAAHVHAMLAVAAATVESCVPDSPSAGWLDIIRPGWRAEPDLIMDPP